MVVGHVVEPGGLHTTLHLGVLVRREVGEQVAAGGDVRALPGVAVAVHRAGARTGDDRVLDVGAADDRGDRGVVLQRVLGDAERGLLEQLRDHRREHLDVAHLLGADAEHHVAVLAGDVHVPRLELLLHGDGDLSVLATEHLLQLAGVDRVGLVGRCRELQFLLVEVHVALLHSSGCPSIERVRVRWSARPPQRRLKESQIAQTGVSVLSRVDARRRPRPTPCSR
ncbi:hypothetical protein EXIGUO8A_790002 [Exiguobacterium sp. 8A]|nr:hypothetical protein EXIGUO8A_790002 [Exiguobacterium sp. 8A]